MQSGIQKNNLERGGGVDPRLGARGMDNDHANIREVLNIEVAVSRGTTDSQNVSVLQIIL